MQRGMVSTVIYFAVYDGLARFCGNLATLVDGSRASFLPTRCVALVVVCSCALSHLESMVFG